MEGLQPPYLVMGNHTNFYDPFLVSCCIRDHICFVASDEYFRNPLLRGLLKWVGAIPKAKFVSDGSAVKEIRRLKEQKSAIGIYPEGSRCWDGRTLPLFYSTSRLIKSLSIPVVTALTRGGYLSYPRWAVKNRKGKMILDIRRLLTAEEAASLSPDEIHQKLTEALSYREEDWQRAASVRFEGKQLAEHLEYYLHTCPQCRKTGQMESHDDIFFCNACSYRLRYTTLGFFESDPPSDHPVIFDNAGDWGAWQQQHLENRITLWKQGGDEVSPDQPLLEEENVSLLRGGWRRRFFTAADKGALRLTASGLELAGQRGVTRFESRLMMGLVVNHKNKVDFFYRDRKLYRLHFSRKNVSGVLWAESLKLMKRAGRDLKAEKTVGIQS
jgi:1-acyl-sn-glycerol-3-phosphate acyltransferase